MEFIFSFIAFITFRHCSLKETAGRTVMMQPCRHTAPQKLHTYQADGYTGNTVNQVYHAGYIWAEHNIKNLKHSLRNKNDNDQNLVTEQRCSTKRRKQVFSAQSALQVVYTVWVYA